MFRRRALRSPTSPPGFSLVEVSLTIAITSILLLAVGGTLILTTNALGTGPGEQLERAAAEQLAVLSAEAATATNIAFASPTDLTLTVPDRNADGVPELIRYCWSGVKGDPIMRSLNGGTPSACIASVQSFLPTLLPRPAAVPVESGEIVLASCDSPLLATVDTENLIDDAHTVAQYIRPTFPPGTTAWRITKVRLFLKKNAGNTKNLALSIQSVTSSLRPSGAVLGGAIFTSGSLPGSAAWVEYALTPVGNGLTLTPDQAVCIVVQAVSGGSGKVTTVKNGTNQPFNTHWMTTGSPPPGSWSAANDAEDMRFYLTGTVTTLAEP